MKRILVVLFFFMAAVVALPAPPQNTFSPDQIKFGPVPPVLPAGAQLAVLEGDPMGPSGDFTLRLKMPDGYRIAPHWHPKRENVTVVSGNFQLGMGCSFVTPKMKTFGAVNFASMVPRRSTQRIAVVGTGGPVHRQDTFQINYVNPRDNPSMKK